MKHGPFHGRFSMFITYGYQYDCCIIIFPVSLFALRGKDVLVSKESSLSLSGASFLPGTGGPMMASDGSGRSMVGQSICLWIAKKYMLRNS